MIRSCAAAISQGKRAIPLPREARGIYTAAGALAGREFDFVIVGAGSAGCRLAHRLTEEGSASVLLVEAGGDSQPELPGTGLRVKSTPFAHCMLHRLPETDWCLRTERQKYAFQDREEPGVAPYARGKGPGGSGAINFMLWVRGARQDFDTWARLGADGWSYKDCLPYFMRAEDVNEAIAGGLAADSTQRGTQGVSGISMAPGYRTDTVSDALLDHLRGSGYALGDYNDLRASGNWAGRMQFAIRNGERASPEQVLTRRLAAGTAPGLTFATGGHAAAVLLAENGRSARGVRLIDQATGNVVDVRARRETILSSGVVGSPQILMLSGIGPRDHLESLGITCTSNLPVGQNWSDHAFVVYRVVGGELLTHHALYGPTEKLLTAEEVGDYTANKKGLLSKVFCDVNAFCTPVGSRTDGGPDFQLISAPAPFGGEVFRHAMDGRRGIPGTTGDELAPTLTTLVSIAQPKSRGFLALKSRDPLAAPALDLRFYDHPEDLDVHVAGVRHLQALCSSGPFHDSKPWIPEVKTDADVREFIKSHVIHGWHGMGTCRMGQPDDPAVVVDPALRVRGVDALRVVDCSVCPVVTSGNTNAPTIMVAEKGADLIKRDHRELFA